MSTNETDRSAEHLEHAQNAHDAAVGMGAKCSAAKAAQSRFTRLLSPGTLAKRKSPVDESPSMRHDTPSAAGRVAVGASGSVVASHLPVEGTMTSMAAATYAAIAQVVHDHAVHLGASCPDAAKLAGDGALAKIKAARSAGRYFGPTRL